MKTWKFIIGACFVVLSVAGITFLAGNPLLWYVDILSAVILALFTLPVLVAVHGWKGYWAAFRLALRREPASGADYRSAVAVLDSSIRMMYIAAALGTMIATIGILAHVAVNPGSANQPNNYAVALITLFYAMVFHLAVLEPIRSRLRRLAASAGE